MCLGHVIVVCHSTKTQVNPSSALNSTKHHQSNLSNVPGIPNSNLLKGACIYTPKIIDHKVRPDPSSITGSSPQSVPLLLPDSSLPEFLSSGFTTSLVYLTSVERVRRVSLCSLERQDSPLLQGLKVAEDPLSVILTSTTPPYLLLTGNRGAELTLTASQNESGLQVTQRLSPFPLEVLTNYNDPDLIAPGRLVVSG